MRKNGDHVQRQTGVALWRQIADRIRDAIVSGTFDESGKLPAEMALAAQFDVNRHTVRSALAALADEGIVKAVQGRGTLIERKRRLNFPISRRTRFTQGVGDQAHEKQGLMLGAAEETAGLDVASRLGLPQGSTVIRLESLRKADRRPVSRSTSWFCAKRFAGIVEAYEASGSITAAFAAVGLPDYVRILTEVSASHADSSDLADLNLSPGAILLVTRAVNADLDGRPVQYSVTRFPADLVQFTIEN